MTGRRRRGAASPPPPASWSSSWPPPSSTSPFPTTSYGSSSDGGSRYSSRSSPDSKLLPLRNDQYLHLVMSNTCAMEIALIWERSFPTLVVLFKNSLTHFIHYKPYTYMLLIKLSPLEAFRLFFTSERQDFPDVIILKTL